MIEIGNIYSDDWFGKNISLSVSFFLNEEIILYDNPLRVFFWKLSTRFSIFISDPGSTVVGLAHF